ncbi:hypothetical protein, partial [Enterobacter hormaechei]|uniref:hypothetical protein n=1 Tax=Enterobacter hormaechei TaxID=158836 RepID=UPI001954EF87
CGKGMNSWMPGTSPGQTKGRELRDVAPGRHRGTLSILAGLVAAIHDFGASLSNVPKRASLHPSGGKGKITR